jgi:hypothetical protein
VEFHDWITQKYIQWRGDAIGRERSIKEFAEDHLGVSQSLMSQWMKKGGKTPRSQATIGKLVAVYGTEVYNVLDIEPPDQVFADLAAAYYSLPESKREEFVRRFLDSISRVE